jgi:hypothetical protein
MDFTKTDLFGSVGSDFTLAPRANYSVGVGRRFNFKQGKKLRWEVTATYTYENNGNHGFLATHYASHNASLGLVRSIHLPGRFTSFAAVHSGSTTYSGQDKDPKAFVSGTYGIGMHIRYRYTLSVNETYSKVETRPTYFTTGAGLSHGWWSISSNFNRTSGDYRARINLGISLSALLTGEHKEHLRIFHLGR